MSDPTFRVSDDGAGRHVLIGEADTPVGKAAVWQHISPELLADAAPLRGAVESLLAGRMRRLTHPWEFPDRNPMPHVDPVPWFTSRLLRYRAWRQRIRDAREVLRYGLDDAAAYRDWDR